MFEFAKQNGNILDKQNVSTLFNCLSDGIYIVSKKKQTRTNQQNKYYWSILSYIAEETGELDYYRLHELMKSKFMKQTTTDMDTATFTDYIDFVKDRSLNFLGIIIPDEPI